MVGARYVGAVLHADWTLLDRNGVSWFERVEGNRSSGRYGPVSCTLVLSFGHLGKMTWSSVQVTPSSGSVYTLNFPPSFSTWILCRSRIASEILRVQLIRHWVSNGVVGNCLLWRINGSLFWLSEAVPRVAQISDKARVLH